MHYLRELRLKVKSFILLSLMSIACNSSSLLADSPQLSQEGASVETQDIAERGGGHGGGLGGGGHWGGGGGHWGGEGHWDGHHGDYGRGWDGDGGGYWDVNWGYPEDYLDYDQDPDYNYSEDPRNYYNDDEGNSYFYYRFRR